MKILTFDTSTDVMYITISINDVILEYKILEGTANNYPTAFLIPEIIKLLKKTNLTMQDIEAVGINVGPGSFTGIRTSATVARVMGQSLDIPLVGVPSLEILSRINNSSKNAVSLLDARKGKAYIGVYSQNGDIIRNPEAITYEEAISYVKENNSFCITDLVMSEKLNTEEIKNVNFQNLNINWGNYLANLTYKKLKSKDKEKNNWFNLKPLYIQPPPISMPKSILK